MYAYLKASDIQYAMNDVTPHLRACLGTGSRSTLVLLKDVNEIAHTDALTEPLPKPRNRTYHRALPSANWDFACSTWSFGLLILKPIMAEYWARPRKINARKEGEVSKMVECVGTG